MVAGRLTDAGISLTRFIDVAAGRKQSYNHTQHEPDAVTGNYGIYCGNGLVGFDIDDYSDDTDTNALADLPSTFSVRTPHGGEHRYYKGSSGTAGTIGAATGGSRNVSLSGGEIYGAGKYLVGPGSCITECEKAHLCSGGEYAVLDDRPIAEINPRRILDVLAADREASDGGIQSALGTHAAGASGTKPRDYLENQDLSMPDPEILAKEDPGRKLWKTIVRHHRHNEVETGVEVVRVLDRAEELGLDRWRTSERLVHWVDTGRLKKSHATNRIAPSWAELPSSGERVKGEQTGLNWF